MGDLLIKKALGCRDRIVKIRGALPARPEEILADERTEAFISFQMFLLIQDLVDLGAHLVSARSLGLPTSQRETFDLLARAGIVSPETSRGMGAMSSLRNRIAQSYGELDPVRLAREAPSGLAQAACFLDEITTAVETSGR
ncbi:MAG TPA: DUF86 domain-containing protein [Polyangia bacterium]|nr:DUF86 domain-containing protein [Polyangia bacterium]